MLISGLPGDTFVLTNVRSWPYLALGNLFKALSNPHLVAASTGLCCPWEGPSWACRRAFLAPWGPEAGQQKFSIKGRWWVCCLSQRQSTESLPKYFPDLGRVEPLLGSPVGLPEVRSFYQLSGDREVPTRFLVIDGEGGRGEMTRLQSTPWDCCLLLRCRMECAGF